jgi:hypothetical protein
VYIPFKFNQQPFTIEDVRRNVPRVYATLDSQQVEHKSSMIEIEGMIVDMPIIVLVDSGSSFNYINSNPIMKCHLASTMLR